MEFFGIIIVFIIVAVLIRLMAGSFDGQRVEAYLKQHGWELVSRDWDPFGPGWFGGKNSRIYRITYRDRIGNLHRAHVKTSMLSGVYLTNDHIVESAPTPEPPGHESLRDENERLAARLRELEQRPD